MWLIGYVIIIHNTYGYITYSHNRPVLWCGFFMCTYEYMLCYIISMWILYRHYDDRIVRRGQLLKTIGFLHLFILQKFNLNFSIFSFGTGINITLFQWFLSIACKTVVSILVGFSSFSKKKKTKTIGNTFIRRFVNKLRNHYR